MFYSRDFLILPRPIQISLLAVGEEPTVASSLLPAYHILIDLPFIFQEIFAGILHDLTLDLPISSSPRFASPARSLVDLLLWDNLVGSLTHGMSSSTTTTTTTTATTRCAACRYLRRRCSEECVLAPYFPSTHPERFAYVHRIFGASNVSRMIQQISIHQRTQAADSISYEAYWRVRDPVYGSVGIISLLQQEICMKQHELAKTQGLIAMYASRPQGGHLAEPAGLDDAWQQGLLGWDQVTAVPGLPKPPPPPSDFM